MSEGLSVFGVEGVLRLGDKITFQAEPFRFHGPIWKRVWDWLRGRDLEEPRSLTHFIVGWDLAAGPDFSAGFDPDWPVEEHGADALAYGLSEWIEADQPALERAARAVCSKRCVREGLAGEACLNSDGSNGPCLANSAQLAFAGPMDAACAAIESLLSVDVKAFTSLGYHGLNLTRDTAPNARAAFIAGLRFVLRGK